MIEVDLHCTCKPHYPWGIFPMAGMIRDPQCEMHGDDPAQIVKDVRIVNAFCDLLVWLSRMVES